MYHAFMKSSPPFLSFFSLHLVVFATAASAHPSFVLCIPIMIYTARLYIYIIYIIKTIPSYTRYYYTARWLSEFSISAYEYYVSRANLIPYNSHPFTRSFLHTLSLYIYILTCCTIYAYRRCSYIAISRLRWKVTFISKCRFSANQNA